MTDFLLKRSYREHEGTIILVPSDNRVPTLPLEQPTRDGAIDSFRFLMAMLVVILHLLPVDTKLPLNMKPWAALVDAACRSAVPYFFMVSGYYFKEKRTAWDNSKRVLSSLAPIYIFWCLLYLLFSFCVPDPFPVKWWAGSPLDGYMGWHLWFLPALALGMMTLAFTFDIGGWRLSAAVATVLVLIGPLLYDYHQIFGIEHYPDYLAKLGRQLAAPAFVLIGFTLRKAPPLDLKISLLLCFLSFSCLLAERYYLAFGLGNHFVRGAEGLISTFAYGTTTFLVARSLNKYSWASWLAPMGSLSLAIYVCHVLFVWVALRITPQLPAQTLVMFLSVAFFSTVTAAVLVRIPLMRDLCTPPSARASRGHK